MAEEPGDVCVVRDQRDDSIDPKRQQKMGQEMRLVIRISIHT